MVLSEMARKVTKDGQLILFKYNKDNNSYDVKFDGGNKRGWTILDSWSASVYLTVFNACSDENKAKLDRMPIKKALNVAFNIVSKRNV